MNEKKKPRRRQLSFVDVREIALSMPEVEETTAYGMPAFNAGKTRFAGQPYPRPDVQPNSIGVPISFEERARLLASAPDVLLPDRALREISRSARAAVEHWARRAAPDP